MTHYIVINENEIVKAEMERPMNFGLYSIGESDNIPDIWECRDYDSYINALPRIPAPGHKWKLWQEVVDGKDLKLQHQIRLSAEWVNASQMTYDINKHNRRIIAIPIQPTPEGEKVEERDLDMALLKQAYNIISRVKNVEDQFLQIACDEWLEIYSEHNKPTHQR